MPRAKRSVVDHQAKFLDHGLPLAFFSLDVLRLFAGRAGERIAAGVEQSFLHVVRRYDLA